MTTQAELRFDGATFDVEKDGPRLGAQLARVRNIMADGKWRTLEEIGAATGDNLQAISARLRDFRKSRFGSNTVDRRRRGEASRGIFEYRLQLRTP